MCQCAETEIVKLQFCLARKLYMTNTKFLFLLFFSDIPREAYYLCVREWL